MNNEYIREKIVKIREEKGWSQALFAEKLGIGRSHMNKFEKGTLQISLPYLKQMAKIFNVPISHFLDASEEKETKPHHNNEHIQTPFDFEGVNRSIQEIGDEESGLTMRAEDLLVTVDKLAKWKENAEPGAIIIGSCACRYLIVIKESHPHPEEKGFLEVKYGFVNIDHAGWTLCDPTFDTAEELIEWFASCVENPVIDVIPSRKIEECLPGDEWI